MVSRRTSYQQDLLLSLSSTDLPTLSSTTSTPLTTSLPSAFPSEASTSATSPSESSQDAPSSTTTTTKPAKMTTGPKEKPMTKRQLAAANARKFRGLRAAQNQGKAVAVQAVVPSGRRTSGRLTELVVRKQREERKSRLRSAVVKKVVATVVTSLTGPMGTPGKKEEVLEKEEEEKEGDDWEVTGSEGEEVESEVDTEDEESRPRKKWVEEGLYVGEEVEEDGDDTASVAASASGSSRRRSRSQKRAPKPLTWFKLPIKDGAERLEKQEDFFMPFNIFCPLQKKVKAPDTWKPTNKNHFIGTAHDVWKGFMEDQSMICACSPDRGCDENCLNRAVYYECNKNNCRLGEVNCGNRPFHDLAKRVRKGTAYSQGVELIMTKDRGYGLRANRSFAPNQIIVEYSGEIITQEECERRIKYEYSKNSALVEKSYYLMTFHQTTIIDADRRGSIARFANHSCDPNCRMEKWFVAGKPRMALFAGDNGIRTGEELTYDYNFNWFSGVSTQKCRCRTRKCRGLLGKRSDGVQQVPSDSAAAASTSKPSKAPQSKKTIVKKVKLPLNTRLRITQNKKTPKAAAKTTGKLAKIATTTKKPSLAVKKPNGIAAGTKTKKAGLSKAPDAPALSKTTKKQQAKPASNVTMKKKGQAGKGAAALGAKPSPAKPSKSASSPPAPATHSPDTNNKRRGRPPKTAHDEADMSNESENATDDNVASIPDETPAQSTTNTPVKRRGRPPKSSLNTVTNADGETTSTPPLVSAASSKPKRTPKTPAPPPAPVQSTPSLTASGKRRGRPPKAKGTPLISQEEINHQADVLLAAVNSSPMPPLSASSVRTAKEEDTPARKKRGRPPKAKEDEGEESPAPLPKKVRGPNKKKAEAAEKPPKAPKTPKGKKAKEAAAAKEGDTKEAEETIVVAEHKDEAPKDAPETAPVAPTALPAPKVEKKEKPIPVPKSVPPKATINHAPPINGMQGVTFIDEGPAFPTAPIPSYHDFGYSMPHLPQMTMNNTPAKRRGRPPKTRVLTDASDSCTNSNSPQQIIIDLGDIDKPAPIEFSIDFKNLSPSVGDDLTPKKRGRPKGSKNKRPRGELESPGDNSLLPTPKRGPGRPRKISSLADGSDPSALAGLPAGIDESDPFFAAANHQLLLEANRGTGVTPSVMQNGQRVPVGTILVDGRHIPFAIPLEELGEVEGTPVRKRGRPRKEDGGVIEGNGEVVNGLPQVPQAPQQQQQQQEIAPVAPVAPMAPVAGV